MDIDDAIQCLRDARAYVQTAHDDAEARHDAYGPDYMSDGMFVVMCHTANLLARIDCAIRNFTSAPGVH